MESRLFPEGTVPPEVTAEWYRDRERARHVDEYVHRPRLLGAAELVMQATRRLRQRYPARNTTIVDLGAGDGGLLTLVRHLGAVWGYDLCPANVAGAAERGVDVTLRDFTSEPVDWAHIVVMTETLEHLLDPHGWLRVVAANADLLVASSPWNETAESHVGYHTWAWDEEGYRALLERAGFVVLEQRRVDTFQVVLAEVPGATST